MDQISLFFVLRAQFRGPQQGRGLRSQLALCAKEEISGVSLRHREGKPQGPVQRKDPVVSRWCRQRCSRGADRRLVKKGGMGEKLDGEGLMRQVNQPESRD